MRHSIPKPFRTPRLSLAHARGRHYHAARMRTGRSHRQGGSATLAALFACCAALFAAAPASADSTPAGDFNMPFTTAQPNSPTGMTLYVLYKDPKDPNAKPSAVDRILFTLPEGTVFDGTAVPACKATDADFQQKGKAACPPETVVGEGLLTVMTGAPGESPFPLDTTVYNSGDGVIELFTDQSTGAYLALERLPFRGKNAFEGPDIADTPGLGPDNRSAAREVNLVFPMKIGPSGRSFITTPPDCPLSRRWTSRFDWRNADGNSYNTKSDMPCVPSNAFSIADVDLAPSGLDVAVRVPGPGTVMVSDSSSKRKDGKRVRKIRNARVQATNAGTVALEPVLGSIARRTLRRGKKLNIGLRITYVPTGGVGASQTTVARYP